MSLKFVSFDLNGTLVKKNFVRIFWFEEIPKLYAKKYSLRFKKALEIVLNEYRKIDKQRVEWYLPEFWAKKFNFSKNEVKLILKKVSKKVKVYKECYSVLNELKEDFRLILVSNTPSSFLKLCVKRVGNFFFRKFSLTSLGFVKSERAFKFVCESLRIKPSELAHVGDDFQLDYLVPRKLGIHSFYLNRKLKKKGKFFVRNLREFKSKLYNLLAPTRKSL